MFEHDGRSGVGMTRSKGPCPRVWACATSDTLMICYGHYHTCHLAAGHAGDCPSGTGPEHTSAHRHGDIVTSVTDIYPILEGLRDGRPSWLDDHRAQELRTFRARFTDQQWDAFRSGACWRCLEQVPPVIRERRHGRVLCDQHVIEVRRGGEFHPHMTSVPTSVASMDSSEVP